MAVGYTSMPGSLDTLSSLLGPSDWPVVVPLIRDISDDATELPLETTNGFAAPPNMVTIDGERIVYTGMTASALTGCARGQFVEDGGLTPRYHPSGSYVRQQHTSTHHRVLAEAIIALQALLVPPGMLAPFSGTVVPVGWFEANGDAKSRTEYAALFAAIGTTWGAGDGSTTFNIPNLQGYVFAGVTPSFTALNAVGKKTGAFTHLLSPAETAIRAHSHSIGGGQTVVQRSTGGTTANTASQAGGTTGNVAAEMAIEAHNNTQPTAAGLWLIKY
jgi:microcystin-dependent protein